MSPSLLVFAAAADLLLVNGRVHTMDPARPGGLRPAPTSSRPW
jgi:hypothetical protein